ncbi:hypothetical protein DUNSADRAFT_1453 [Dunaliella salina]|uniref:Encoded protein n=1 Tax=Dunaliella salina TaxID=3046 RepID=A0ABQ7GX06_DUNSA|nr:hypothetical protein DUNSADRAFT_1453 [Dunaliella salina]|eukprot:KAF5839140.1 hypothetical protein DUNSADRAFT_1453 [Dunaliella salina]
MERRVMCPLLSWIYREVSRAWVQGYDLGFGKLCGPTCRWAPASHGSLAVSLGIQGLQEGSHQSTRMTARHGLLTPRLAQGGHQGGQLCMPTCSGFV